MVLSPSEHNESCVYAYLVTVKKRNDADCFVCVKLRLFAGST